MTRALTLTLTLALALAGARAPQAADTVCDLKLSISNVSLTWSPALGAQTLPFSLVKSKNPACFAIVTFSRGGAADYASRRAVNGPQTLRYQLYKEIALANVLKDWPNVLNPNDYVSDSFGIGKNLTKQFNYYLDLPAPDTGPVKPGLYLDTYTVKAYSNFDFFDPDDTRTVTLQIWVPPLVDISLVASGAPFNESDTAESVNFGVLASGATRGFDVRVRSNAGYSLSFSSQNGGVLRHANAAVATVVGYTVKVNGQTRALAAGTPTVVATGTGATSTDGAVWPVSFTIGDTNDKVAGSYSDNITVTATSND